MSVNLAGANKVETFSDVGVTADGFGPYTNTGGANKAATLTLETTAADVIVTESDDAISGTGNAITVVLSGPGVFEFLGANAYTGGTFLDGGELSIGNAAALGSGALTFGGNGATLQSTVTGSLTNSVTIDSGASARLGATSGHTLTFGGENFTTLGGPGTTLHFGSATDDGTVVLSLTGDTQTSVVGGFAAIDGGTLVLQRGALVIDASDGLTVGSSAAPATLDVDGQGFEDDTDVYNLSGTSAGVITNNGTGSDTTLTVFTTASSTFAGTIENGTSTLALTVWIQGGTAPVLTLTGANTYTGGTTILVGSALQIGDGGTTGSIVGDVVDDGSLAFDLAANPTFGGIISGSGALTQDGDGALTLSGANTFSGGVTIEDGEISIDNISALGTGALTFAGGGSALESAVTGTLTNLMTIDFGVSTTIGATSGNTLTLAASGFSDFGGSGATLHFGSATDDGTVVLAPTGAIGAASGEAGSIDGGTLEIKSGAALLSGMDEGLTVGSSATSATLDFDSQASEFVAIHDLAGTSAGIIANNGASLVLDILCSESSTFAGVIKNGSGPLGVEVQGSGGSILTLTGANIYTGGTEIFAGANLSIGDGGASGSIAGAISDEGTLTFNLSASSTCAGTITGTGSLSHKGAGLLDLTGANSYSGGTKIDAGKLELGASTSAGTGAIGFGENAFATLVLAEGVDPANTIDLADATDAIDFSSLGYAGGDRLVLLSSGAVSTYALESASGSTLETLHFGGSFAVSGLGLGPDGSGGTEIATDYSAALADTDASSIIGADAEIVIDDSAANIAAHSVGITTLIADGDVGSVFSSNAALSDGGVANLGVVGGADTIAFTSAAGNTVSLYSTAGHADTVKGASGTVDLHSAQATVIGSGDIVHFAGASSLTATGGVDRFVFVEGIGGRDSIAGFASTDTIQLSKLDFANFAALQSHLSQSSAGALITLNTTDSITLAGVQETTLTAANFKFV